MVEAPTRLGEWLRGAAARLRDAGIAEAGREARLLWSAASGTELAGFQAPEQVLDEVTVGRLGDWLNRRLAGEPLAHVTGWTGFRRLLLRSDRRALIPRPETEGLVDLLLARVRQGRVADLGTGSGCLALSLADEGDFDQVVGVDRCREALALAGENRRLTGLRVHLVAGDWCRPLAGIHFDALVSNPPYLTESEYEVLDPSVRDHEPAAALASGGRAHGHPAPACGGAAVAGPRRLARSGTRLSAGGRRG